MQPYKIKGAVALVTGSSRGLGRALLAALLERGVKKVYATARQPETLRDLTDTRVVPLQLDVTDADQVRLVADATTDVDLVFNNAGLLLAGGLSNAELVDQARREMDVSYFGALRLIQNLARQANRSPEEVEQEQLARLPAGRIGDPDAMGRLAAILASDLADLVTGAALTADGGATKGLP